MTEGRKDFYNSKLWRKVRLNVWRKQNLLCASCGLPVYVDKLSDYIPKEKRRKGIIHHIEHLTEQNFLNPSISLDESNLVGLCLSCHNAIHGEQPIREDLTFDEEGNLVKK